MNYSIKILDFISNLSEIFTGKYSHNNKELNNLRAEILDVSITPSTSVDKRILKEDLNIFLTDTKKAQRKIKEEMNG